MILEIRRVCASRLMCDNFLLDATASICVQKLDPCPSPCARTKGRSKALPLFVQGMQTPTLQSEAKKAQLRDASLTTSAPMYGRPCNQLWRSKGWAQELEHPPIKTHRPCKANRKTRQLRDMSLTASTPCMAIYTKWEGWTQHT